MELGSIVQFLENKNILVTGATGFLAKIFVEKVLRVQPNVKKLYLLVRAPDSKTALQRLNNEIPADMVVNAMITTIVAHSYQPNEIIYHVGSAVSNAVKYINIHDYVVRYFTMNPWTNKDGKLVKVRQLTVMTSMTSFRSYMTLRYLLPLMVFKVVNTILCQSFKGTYEDVNRKIKFVMRLMELYKPYLFFKGIHDDINTQKLRMALRDDGSETNMFYFDPKYINWENYFMNIHIPGLVKYIFK